jgi:hypothetical protein
VLEVFNESEILHQPVTQPCNPHQQLVVEEAKTNPTPCNNDNETTVQSGNSGNAYAKKTEASYESTTKFEFS